MAEANSGSLMVQKIGDVHIIEFMETNILDQIIIERIKEQILGVIENSGLPKILISFENDKHISSAMLGTLMAVNKAVKAADGELRLCSIDKNLMEVFKLTRLDKVLKIFKNPQAAMAKFVN